MAAPTKKRAVPQNMVVEEENDEIEREDISDDENIEDDYTEEDMEGQEFINQEITVEFEARNLEDCDFHGVRKLLSQLFLKANIDISEMSDTLISQNYVGSAIKQVEPDEDDSDEVEMDDDDTNQVFGVISLLNITEKKNLSCIKQLKSTILDKCSQCANKDKLAAVLNDGDSQIGFIINERFINIPPQIAVPSFESLWKEVDRATKKHMKYDCSHYLMVTKVCKMSVSGPHGATEICSYINGEEELFAEAADFTCQYSVKEERDSAVTGSWDEEDDEMEPYRAVLVIQKDKMADIMVKLKQSYG